MKKLILIALLALSACEKDAIEIEERCYCSADWMSQPYGGGIVGQSPSGPTVTTPNIDYLRGEWDKPCSEVTDGDVLNLIYAEAFQTLFNTIRQRALNQCFLDNGTSCSAYDEFVPYELSYAKDYFPLIDKCDE